MSEYLEENADFNFHYDTAAIGAQGPDIFFFHRIIPLVMPGVSRYKIGVKLHHAKPEKIFEAFREYCAFSPNIDIAKSYIYGFILHYSLDRTCHPYVYSVEKRLSSESKYIHHASVHNSVEYAMDSILLTKHFGISDPSDFDGAATVTDDAAVIDEIAHLLSFTALQVTGEHVSEKEVSRAVLDTAKIQRILRNRNGHAYRFARFSETILAPFIGFFKLSSMIKPKDLEKAKKYANIDNNSWISPFDHSVHDESFEELFNMAKKDSKELIDGFEKMLKGEINGYDLTKNKSFLTGIEVKDE